MKKYIITIIIVLLISVAGYLLYQKYIFTKYNPNEVTQTGAIIDTNTTPSDSAIQLTKLLDNNTITTTDFRIEANKNNRNFKVYSKNSRDITFMNLIKWLDNNGYENIDKSKFEVIVEK